MIMKQNVHELFCLLFAAVMYLRVALTILVVVSAALLAAARVVERLRYSLLRTDSRALYREWKPTLVRATVIGLRFAIVRRGL